jgi:hypothetical protein
MKHVFLIFYVFFFLFLLMGAGSRLLQGEIPYGTGTWDAALLGNHRVVVQVSEQTDAAAVHISWRRRDDDPHKKNIIVIDAETGKRILNVYLVEINREFGDLVFQSKTIPGKYYIYYMPHTSTGSRHYPTVRYLEPEQTAEKEWLQKHHLTSAASAQKKWKQLEQAKVFEIQSIDAFNSFYPMEIIASRRELENLLSKHRDKSYLLFPEDRTHPIRMTADIPYKWIKNGVQTLFKGEAARGEFYTFQIGLYAIKTSIKDIAFRFTDLESKESKAAIPASAIRCFNLGGIDCTGKPFKKQCPVKKGEIHPLWFGLQVPKDLLPGQYEGEVTIAPYRMEVQTVKLRLKVNKKVLNDAGDSEPWRHSRLRWLDSRVASDEKIVPPFTNMRIGRRDEGTLIACLGRILTIDKTGFPTSIRSLFAPEVTYIREGSGREILASPVTLIVEDSNHTVLSWETKEFTITRRSPGAVGWRAQNITASGVLFMDLKGQMEMDGFIQFKITLRASRPFKVSDIRLVIPIVKDVARYMMGLGLKGGYRPTGYKWEWDVKKNQDSAWLGDVNAGLQYSLRGANYSRPLNTNFYQLKPLNMPVSWYNDGKGGTEIFEKGTDTVLVHAYSGERILKTGEELHFDFNLLITPFKPLDTAGQWNHRFYHRFKPLKEIAATGANTVNVHHATEINPFINYPFLRPWEMKAYIDEAGAQNPRPGS